MADIAISLRRTKKWTGQCQYLKKGRYRITLYLAKMWEEDNMNTPFAFWSGFWWTLFHEILHGLGYKLGIPGYRHKHSGDWVGWASSVTVDELRLLRGEGWMVLDLFGKQGPRDPFLDSV